MLLILEEISLILQEQQLVDLKKQKTYRITTLNLKGCLKKYVNKHLHLKYKELWKNNLFNDNKKSNCSNKLRTYRLFKNNFTFEHLKVYNLVNNRYNLS
jgi:hypothetical protein